MFRWLANRVPVTRNESGWGYNGPLSTTKEWHSLGVGLIGGLAAGATGNVELLGVVGAFALGRVGDKTNSPQHLKDVTKEPAYAGGGALAGYLLGLAVKLV